MPARPSPSPSTPSEPAPVVLSMTRRQLVVLLCIVALVVSAVSALLFGPARGAREDLSSVDANLRSTRSGIYKTLRTNRGVLARTTGQLRVVEKSLVIQRQGLAVTRETEDIARVTSEHTATLVRQTGSALRIVRQTLDALGPLQQLRGDVASLVRQTRAAVTLAHSALTVARETLSTGQEALRVAIRTLYTLRSSRDIQRQLLEVARLTLAQTQEINRKIPLPPIFATGAGAPSSLRGSSR